MFILHLCILHCTWAIYTYKKKYHLGVFKTMLRYFIEIIFSQLLPVEPSALNNYQSKYNRLRENNETFKKCQT